MQEAKAVDWMEATNKVFRFERNLRHDPEPPPEPEKRVSIYDVVAHKKMENGRKQLIYIEVDKILHLVTNGRFMEYIHLRRNLPVKVILFQTRQEMIKEIEHRGFFV